MAAAPADVAAAAHGRKRGADNADRREDSAGQAMILRPDSASLIRVSDLPLVINVENLVLLCTICGAILGTTFDRHACVHASPRLNVVQTRQVKDALEQHGVDLENSIAMINALAAGHTVRGVDGAAIFTAQLFFCLYGHSLVQQGKAMRAKVTH
jgi:hypothetical protein